MDFNSFKSYFVPQKPKLNAAEIGFCMSATRAGLTTDKAEIMLKAIGKIAQRSPFRYTTILAFFGNIVHKGALDYNDNLMIHHLGLQKVLLTEPYPSPPAFFLDAIFNRVVKSVEPGGSYA